MSNPLKESNFQDYKRAEQKALEIVHAMQSTSPQKPDIELALMVAIFELHKGELPAVQIAAIIRDHLKSLVPFYQVQETAQSESGS